MDTQTPKSPKSLRDKVCQFCDKGFSSEKTLSSHICIRKRRYIDRDTPGCKLGFRVFQRFYVLSTSAKNPKTLTEFISSKYYTEFVKFARYIIDLDPLASDQFVDFVIRNGIKMSDWCKTYVYEAYLQDYSRREPVERAIERSIIEMSKWADKNNQQYNEFFKNVHPVEATFMLRSCKISPWVLYLASSSKELLCKLTSEQAKMIEVVIEPDFWNKEFSRRMDDVEFVRKVLMEANI